MKREQTQAQGRGAVVRVPSATRSATWPRALALLLVLMLAASAAGCGGDDEPAEQPSANPSVETGETAPAAPPADEAADEAADEESTAFASAFEGCATESDEQAPTPIPPPKPVVMDNPDFDREALALFDTALAAFPSKAANADIWDFWVFADPAGAKQGEAQLQTVKEEDSQIRTFVEERVLAAGRRAEPPEELARCVEFAQEQAGQAE